MLQAGFPVTCPAVSLNRMCGSSQQAIHFAAQAILAGDMDLVIAGGVEMMSHQPLGRDYPKSWPADFPYRLVHQGISAEMMAELWTIGPPGTGRLTPIKATCAPAPPSRAAR